MFSVAVNFYIYTYDIYKNLSLSQAHQVSQQLLPEWDINIE